MTVKNVEVPPGWTVHLQFLSREGHQWMLVSANEWGQMVRWVKWVSDKVWEPVGPVMQLEDVNV